MTQETIGGGTCGTGIAALAALLLGGCSLPMAPILFYNPAAVASARIGGYGTAGIPSGPRVSFRNESAVEMRVRYWVGKRDTTAPGGVADIRTRDDMAIHVKPGDLWVTQAGRPFWPTGMKDAVVWARIDTTDEHGEARQPIWLHLEQPQPYRWSATGCCVESLAFHRHGGGGITPVPRDQWIDANDGPFPVYASAAGR
jgi:hypothetical protein